MKILNGAMIKGAFGKEIRFFFYPDPELKEIIPLSDISHTQLLTKLCMQAEEFRYEKIEPVFPSAEDVTYPIHVDGFSLTAVHKLTTREIRFTLNCLKDANLALGMQVVQKRVAVLIKQA